MRPSFVPALLTGALCFTALSAPAQDLAQRLRKATEATDLDSFTAKPWHLTMQVTTYDDNGKNPQNGTIEVKRSGANSMTSYTFPSGHRVDLIANGQRYQLLTGVVPFFAEVALHRVLHLGPDAEEFEGAEPKLEHEKVGTFTFDCITLSHTMKYPDVVPLGVFPSYCFRSGTDDLRLAYDFAAQLIVVNSTGKFGDRIVPVTLNINEQDHPAVSAKVTALSAFAPTEADFTPPAGAANLALTIREVPQLKPEYKPLFYLPEESRRRGLTGTVVMHVVVDAEGHVHNIRPVTFPDGPMLVEAIVMARKYLYKPYVENGVPTEVNTTIAAAFTSGSGVDSGGIRH